MPLNAKPCHKAPASRAFPSADTGKSLGTLPAMQTSSVSNVSLQEYLASVGIALSLMELLEYLAPFSQRIARDVISALIFRSVYVKAAPGMTPRMIMHVQPTACIIRVPVWDRSV
jgi:hypothetical protein